MQITLNNKFYTHNNSIKPKLSFGVRLKPPLKEDTITFCGNDDLLNAAPKLIISRIESAIRDKNNCLGEGCEGTVYSIPQTDYCVKIPHSAAHKKKLNFKKFFSLQITEEDKINHVKAHLGDGIVLMKKIIGRTLVSCSDNIDDLASFPVSSFREFLKQISEAHNKNMFFDAINGNIIINNKNRSITAIDFVPENSFTCYDDFLPLRAMYYSLVDLNTDSKNRRLIADKILNAALEELKPGNIPCLDISEFDFGDFISIIDTDYDKNVYSKIESLLLLKDMEISGKNVKHKLVCLYREIKKLLHK